MCVYICVCMKAYVSALILITINLICSMMMKIMIMIKWFVLPRFPKTHHLYAKTFIFVRVATSIFLRQSFLFHRIHVLLEDVVDVDKSTMRVASDRTSVITDTCYKHYGELKKVMEMIPKLHFLFR